MGLSDPTTAAHEHMLYDGVPICTCGDPACSSLDAVYPPGEQ